jgi:hypothetical protein
MISDKDSESAISSDGEFIDAGKINIYDEGDSHIDKIEKAKTGGKFLRDSIYAGPDHLLSKVEKKFAMAGGGAPTSFLQYQNFKTL